MQKRLHLLIAMMVLLVSQAMAQITTSGVNGKVTANGEDVIGATVTATHQPSGTVYRAVTNIDGRYTIQGMRPGGPYKVEISYVGYEPKTFEKIQLSLGESTNLSCKLQEDAQVLQDVVVTGKAGLAASRTGAATSMNAQQINDMPSITHGIADVARLNPQLTVTNSGTMSFAGTNNRYNNFMIDGEPTTTFSAWHLMVAMVVKLVLNLYLWKPSNKSRLALRLLMFAKVVSQVVPSMLSPSRVPTSSMVLPISMVTTKT